MNAWYYAKDGQQNGPVALEELIRLFATGSVGPKDLVWHEGMLDWKPAGEVPELAPPPPPHPQTSDEPPPVPAAGGAFNPYQVSGSSWTEQARQEVAPTGEEIVPGSQPLEIGDCVKRAFELTKRHFVTLLGIGVVYFAVSWGFGFVSGLAVMPFGESHVTPEGVVVTPPMAKAAMVIQNIVIQIFSIYIGLGLIRVGLNLVSGKEASVSMLFGEGGKLVNAVFASIIYYAMVLVGFVLLIVPGIYLALRFGQYMNAIVDKDLGAMEALKYSAKITEGNKLNLFGLGIVCFLIVIAGLLALIVGLIFAAPVAWLATMVAYRWLQYGRAALVD